MAVTTLSTLLNRINRFQSLQQVEEQYKVRDLDDALRTLKRSYDLPFYQKLSSLKVFSGIYQYPPAADHDYLIYIDYPQLNIPFGSKFRARYTSMRQFMENPDFRNQVAEIWENGKLTLGVRQNSSQDLGLASQELDSAQSASNYACSGDASDPRVDNVNFVTGDASIQFTVTQSTNAALVEIALDDPFTDPNYKRNWQFFNLYFDGLPASVQLRLGADSSNYLHGTVTTQFAGQPFLADQWNVVAIDLNSASTVGTVNTSTTFAYEAFRLNNAPTGTYNVDESDLRSWQLMDYWYYSKYAVETSGATQADQEYFYNDDTDTYATSSSLVGDHEWADVIMYDAIITGLADKENLVVMSEIKEKRKLAWEALEEKWPELKPAQTTDAYRFQTDYTGGDGYYGDSFWS